MNKIIDPKKPIRAQIPIFSIGDYYTFVDKTECEKNSINQYLDKDISANKHFAFFIRDFLTIITNLLVGIRMLSHFYLQDVNVLLRSQLESIVDLYWVYSLFLHKNEVGVKLAKRFYQFGAIHFLEVSSNFENIIKKDPFFTDVLNKIDFGKQRDKAKSTKLIEIYDKNASEDLISIQKNNWRAVPGLNEDLDFATRSNKAIKLVLKLSNLKKSPYKQNWKTLNSFTHPSSLQIILEDEDVLKAFYKKNLDISLGIVHDSFNLSYHFLKQMPPPPIIEIRNKFHWFSL
jgi:hypothetical protein